MASGRQIGACHHHLTRGGEIINASSAATASRICIYQEADHPGAGGGLRRLFCHVISAMRSGQILTPFGVLMAFVGVPTGFLLARMKRYKWMFVMSYALLTAVMSGAVFFTAQTPIVWGVVVATMAGLGWGAVPTMKTLIVQCAVPKRLLGVATGAFFFSVTMGLTISPAVLGSVMNTVYADTLKASLPAALNQMADEATMTSLGNPRVLLSKPALKALQESLKKTGNEGQALFEQTVDAIHTSMEAGLRSVFLVCAVTMLLSLLLILALPVISMDVEVEDRKAPKQVAAPQPATPLDSRKGS